MRALPTALRSSSRGDALIRHVKGILFSDYVRMIRTHKGVDWQRLLSPEDARYLSSMIEPDDWYPMETFERLGNAILSEIAHGDLDAVRMWGRFSVDQLRAAHSRLLAEGDPVETLMRFRVLRATFFDFEALEIPMLVDDEAQIVIRYHMGNPAEEAASFQTMGFFERLIELAGGSNIYAHFTERSWAGDPRTLLDLSWRTASR
jgi:hypothetical protein